MKVKNNSPVKPLFVFSKISCPPNQTKHIITPAPIVSFNKEETSFLRIVLVCNFWWRRFSFLNRLKINPLALKDFIILTPLKLSSIDDINKPSCSWFCWAVLFRLFPTREITNAEIGSKKKDANVKAGLI